MNAMGGRSDDEIDALLSQGGFPGPTRDRVFEGALRDAGIAGASAPRAPSSRWRRSLALAGVSLAVSAAVFVLPRVMRQGDPFRAKGGPAGAIDLDATCAGPPASSLAACPQGSTLVFSIVGAPPSGGYLAGYAEPRSSGERIWYFSADGVAPALPANTGGATAPFNRAIRIGPEHAPGEYRLVLVVTRVPVGKADLLARPAGGDVLAAREMSLRVVAAPPQGGP